MKILLTGVNGQLGWELERTLSTIGLIISCDRQNLDLTSEDAIRNQIRAHKPDLIVNAAAYTAVDQAESNRDLAYQINAHAPAIMAEEAEKIGAAIIHYSTDYVFDGESQTPYKETDQTNPLNIYGASKLEGERAIQDIGIPHLILRTSWVYANRGHNFLLTMLKLMQEKTSLNIVSDQYGAPTWSRTIAEASAQIIIQWNNAENQIFEQQTGIYNLTSKGKVSWYGYALNILGEARMLESYKNIVTINPIPSTDYPVPARRPNNSSLDLVKIERAFNLELPDWKIALSQCIHDYELKGQ